MDIKNIILNSIVYDLFGKRSYSQTGEDLIAANYFPRGYRGFYVDVGGYHPKQFSNTYYFYKRGWRGIVLEPNEEMSGLYHLSRPRDKVIIAGGGEKEGKGDYYIFAEATRNTFSAKEAEHYQNQGQKLERVENRLILPLNKIMSKEKVDLLSVDTEGNDLDVLKGNNWKIMRPKIVIVENEDAGDYLVKLNYRLAGKTPYSYIYLDAK